MKNHDITKTETGLQQYDRVGKTREPSIGYQDGDRLSANDLGNRSQDEDDTLKDAMRAATGNRRDQPVSTSGEFVSEQDTRPATHVGGGERGRKNLNKQN